jgi:hypothetical protein
MDRGAVHREGDRLAGGDGAGLVSDRLEADYDQGLLTLRLPVAEAAKPRRVEITRSAGGQRSIVEGQQAAPSPDEANPALRRDRRDSN